MEEEEAGEVRAGAELKGDGVIRRSGRKATPPDNNFFVV